MKNIIYPSSKENVMDLLTLVGVDVSDWANFKGKHPASNPKYCYEWSFIEPGKVVVLNLWYEDIIEKNETLYLKDNFREDAKYFSDNFKKGVWSKRALKMDKAIQTALRDNLVVRTIICSGNTRRRKVLNAEASKVENRMLDPIPWTITSYNWNNGDCILTRGAKSIKIIDQFIIEEEKEKKSPDKKEIKSSVFIRNPKVRRNVLIRSNGKCEYCEKFGFEMEDGRIYLETHHIIALAEKGEDKESNVVALCPNHHREAHYGNERKKIKTKLLEKMKLFYPFKHNNAVN